jgi:cell division protein FtsZ
MNDVKTVMKDSGVAIMGSGRSSGEGRAKRAVLTALESPLLNDNDITGANFILLNITYGNDEVLMDEISEITDYIQEQAGMGAEVIWGYGQDLSLGDDVCVTVIATGFQAKSVESLLPMPEQEPKKMWLETEGAKEVTAKVEKPTVEIPEVRNEVKDTTDEPFIKTVDAPLFEMEFEVKNEITDETPSFKLEQENIPELSSLKHNVQDVVNTIDQPILHTLGHDINDIVNATAAEATDSLKITPERTLSDRPSRTELISRNKEREMRIREFTIKLKTPSGLSELENEPAYARKKISLDSAPHSSESTVSRFSLNESTDENGNKRAELGNNPFLHDNVD